MSFITAPFRVDRGKKITYEQSHYNGWDYLKDTRPEAEKRVFPIGKSDGRASKFKVGFYRRPAAAIQSDLPRLEYAASKSDATAAAAAARFSQLSEVSSRNGNVLVPVATDEKLFPSRRHFPSRADEVAQQNHARQKVGASRFHLEATPQESAHRTRQIAHRLESQKQTTSMLGYGRSDLATYGVVDNFRPPHAYTERDLLSRPKLKAAPADIAAAHAPSGLALSDGSGFGGAAGASRPAAGRATLSSAPVSRRVNRSNQTSTALAQVFQYEQVDTWQRATQRNAPPTAATPATAP